MAHIGNQPFGKTVRTITTETLASVKTQFYPTGGYTIGYVDVWIYGCLIFNNYSKEIK
jgi:hypothetical protein